MEILPKRKKLTFNGGIDILPTIMRVLGSNNTPALFSEVPKIKKED